MSNYDFFFTRIETGDIKFVKVGDSLDGIIYDIPNKYLDKNKCFCNVCDNTIPENNKSWLNKKLGIWYIGLPGVKTIHSFPIKRETENPDGDGPSHWTIKKDPILTKSLRFEFPRPFVPKGVELKNGTPIDLLIVGKFQVIDPVHMVFILKGDFFVQTESILRSYINDEISKIENFEAFVEKEKAGKDGILYFLTLIRGSLNKKLKKEIGIILTDISIPQYQNADPSIQEATNKLEITKIQAENAREEAKGKADARDLETASLVKREKDLGEAKNQAILAGIESADPNKKAEVVLESRKAESIGGKDSKVTTWVEKGNDVKTTKIV